MQSSRHSKSLIWISGLVVCGAILVGLAPPAQANPPGIPEGWHKVFQFNLIGHPHEYEGNCGQGNRVFVERGDNHAHLLVIEEDRWDIVDCNATGNNTAVLTADDPGEYALFVRVLGPAGDHGQICREDPLTHECLADVDQIDLKREHGQARFKTVPRDLFDDENEDILWQIDAGTGFKIAQFRVYHIPD